MTGFGDRLREAIKLRGTTQDAVADAIGHTQGSIGHMLKRDEPPKKIVELARALNVRVEWLALGEGPMEGERQLKSRGVSEDAAAYTVSSLSHDQFVMIPRFDIQASAGPGMFAEEELVVEHLPFKEDWIRRTLMVDPRHLALLTATGDSMENTIRSGDMLLINRSVQAFQDDAIYVIAIGGPIQVKRIQLFFSGSVAVKSDNPAYHEQMLTPEEAEHVHVAGRVCWIARMM